MVPSGLVRDLKCPRSSSPELGSVSRREPPPGPEVPGAVTECLSRGTAAPLTVYETARGALCRSASTARAAPRRVAWLRSATVPMTAQPVGTASSELAPSGVAEHEIQHATDDQRRRSRS